tara:strand:+ start:27 stop:1724 length:1698 start_codon:yes stop_codon:yes gene_type:complete
MVDQNFQRIILDLFSRKKYNDIILKVEEYSKRENRPGGLSSFVGVCKMLNPNYTEEDVISALSDFEDAYKKLKTQLAGIEALGNYIAACIKNSQKYLKVIDYLDNAKVMFDEAEKNFPYNEKLFLSGVDLYKYLLNPKKVLQLSKEVLKNNSKLKINACTYGMMNNYIYDWGIKDYFDYSQNFKNFFPKLNVKNISDIEYKKNNKIRIGFVSPDFVVNHSVTYFVKNTLKYLDKNIFEIFVYQIGDSSFLKDSSQELKDNADHWLDLTKISNQEIVNKIQNDRIEIMFDVMGLTGAKRIEIFNNRVCPLQVSWLAFCNTVGFDDIDFLIADKNLIYESEEKYYSEKILKLPDVWNCHSGFLFKREKPELPFENNKFISFGSFNNFLKISDEVIRTWSKILKEVKNSKLILKSSFSYQTTNIISKFKNYGVDKQLVFFDRQNYNNVEDHLNLYKNIDIGLDTFPYNGVTTTFEALWAGVPVFVMKGYNFNSRCGESIMKNGNLEYFIAKNEQQYVEKVVHLANNKEKLIFERDKLFKEVLKTPLYDSNKFAIGLKKELLKVYNRKL